jgi:GNAT superfamily N-acetyltransferase
MNSATAGTQVRKATSAHAPRLVRALARAFYDDPMLGHWLLPEESQRLQRLERGFRFLINDIYLRHEQCYTTDALLGGALWLPPGEWKLGALGQLRLLPAMARAARTKLPRVLRLFSFLEAHHPREPPHFYLPVIGVDPASQGRGIGSALLAPVLERCDRQGLPAYLEASSQRNRALYLRHGFRVNEEIRLPGDGPPIWPMWREPRR